MTFELLEKIIIEEQIPKDVELLADTENDLGTEDMDCIQYSAERKEICFTPSYYLDYPAHDEGIDHSKWSILWCGENCDFDRPYYSERICDLSDTLLRMQIRRKHAPHIMKLLKRWYFGHFHENREYLQAEMLYEKIKELGTGKTMICVGRPKYKKGELVLFDFDNGKEKIEKYGKISIVDEYGTFFQREEVSYDIVDSEGILNKHIPESDICGFGEMRDE